MNNAGLVGMLLLGVLLRMPAVEPVIADCSATVVPGDLFRLLITVDGEDPGGQGILVARLRQGERLLAVERVDLDRFSQLQRGVLLHLPVPADLGPATVDCIAELRFTGRDGISRSSRQRPSWGALVDRLGTLGTALGERPAALPALWLEQALNAVRRRPDQVNAARLGLAVDRLEAWLDGRHDWQPAAGASAELAYRCPIDGSCQPYRWYRSTAAPRGVVLVCDGSRPLAKDDWPALPRDQVAAARAAGLDLIAWYPARDHRWTGIALRRAQSALPGLLRRHGLDHLPRAVVGARGAALGAIHLAARDPWQFPRVLLIDPHDPPLTAAVPPALPDRADSHWLAERLDPTAWSDQLAQLSLGVSGRSAGDMTALLTRLQPRFAGLSGLAPAATAEPWLWLANQLSLPDSRDDRSWRVLAPGSFGPLEVEALTEWGRPGRLHLLSTAAGPRVIAEGIAAVDWRGRPPIGLQLPSPTAAELPPKRAGAATGPVDRYADDAFLIVVGSGESVHAQRQNERTAQAFARSWVAHAEGMPPLLMDSDPIPDAWADHHLVCIGNPLSNALLARLWASGTTPPVSWDHRSIRLGERRWLRAAGAVVVLAWPHPAADGRLLVVIDGPWQTPEPGRLPLQGLPDLSITAPGQDPLHRLFDSHWRLQGP